MPTAIAPTPVTPTINPATHPVVFFDGDCAFCNAGVTWLLHRDRRAVLRFAPLQGETAAGVVSADDLTRMNSVVLLDGDGLHRRSTAAVRMLRRLGGRYRLLAGLLWLVPRPLRDVGYDVVAAFRKRLPGAKKSLCKMPTPEERTRLLP